jgi:hypothetical protein
MSLLDDAELVRRRMDAIACQDNEDRGVGGEIYSSLLEKGFENANGLENGWLVRKRQKVESIVNMETG